MLRLQISVCSAVVLAVAILSAQTQPSPPPLFTAIAPPAAAAAVLDAARATRAALDRRVVGLNLAGLFEPAAPRVTVNIDQRGWVARLERVDTDIGGHRSWVGVIEGIELSHVSITEREGVVNGVINALTDLFAIRTLEAGIYALEQIDASRTGGELEPQIEPVPAAEEARAVAAADDGSVIDVLFLYTPSARSRQGGAAGIGVLAAQIVSDSNTVFQRSGVVTRLRLAGTAEFPLQEAWSMDVDLASVAVSPVAAALRNQYSADVVQLLVSDLTRPDCGIARLLTSLSNPSFAAYSVVDVDCVAQYTATHEIAHNFGSHHAPDDPRGGPGLFSYSYGYKDSARQFRTVMAYGCANANCPRIPHMSNPGVTYNGGATGTATQNNTLSMNNAAFVVANFRSSQPNTVTPPAAPSGLRTTVAGGFVTASWNAVPGATGYVVQVGTAPGASNVFNAAVGNVTAASGVAPPGQYYWRVIALNGAGASAPSAEMQFLVGCAPPSAPAALSMTQIAGLVTVTWAPVDAVTTYIVEAGSAPGLANLYNAAVGLTTSVSARPAPATYYVRVRAQNACGTSPSSPERVIVVP